MKTIDFHKIDKADLQSIGYAAASQGDATEVMARELVRRYPGGALSDEARAELEKGMIGRKAELMGTVYYVHKGSEYTAIESPKEVSEDDAIFSLTVHYASGLTAYEFGQLKTKDPAQYEMVAKWRDAVNKYKSNRMNSLMAAIKAVLANKTGRTRDANKSYLDWIADNQKGVVQAMLKRAATARKNSDPTAPKDKADLIKMLTHVINKA
jgi:hypothetical protein